MLLTLEPNDFIGILLAVTIIIITIGVILNYTSSYKIRNLLETELDEIIPTPEEMAIAMTKEIMGSKEVFNKFLLPIMGQDRRHDGALMAAFLEGNPMLAVIEAVLPGVAEVLKKKPMAFLRLPALIGQISPQIGAILNTAIGSQFQMLTMALSGELSHEQLQQLQQAELQATQQKMQQQQMAQQQAQAVQQATQQSIAPSIHPNTSIKPESIKAQGTQNLTDTSKSLAATTAAILNQPTEKPLPQKLEKKP